MQVMLMRLMSKGEYVIVPKGTKFTGAGKLGLKKNKILLTCVASLEHVESLCDQVTNYL